MSVALNNNPVLESDVEWNEDTKVGVALSTSETSEKGPPSK